MAGVKRLFGSREFTNELLWGKHTPIAYKADFVQSGCFSHMKRSFPSV
jgi:hypothetical protein